MIKVDEKICPICKGNLIYYDTVKRILRTENGKIERKKLRRFLCESCNSIHRELPNYILPYKHYRKDIVEGFISGQLLFDLQYEDYPCDLTISRWRSAK